MLAAGTTIFFTMGVQYWDKPYAMKAHHTYDVKSVILRGEVIETEPYQIKVKLTNNNGFERDGETFVIYEGQLLSNQDFQDFEQLGKWRLNQ